MQRNNREDFVGGGFSPFDWIISVHSGASKRWKQPPFIVLFRNIQQNFTSESGKLLSTTHINYYAPWNLHKP